MLIFWRNWEFKSSYIYAMFQKFANYYNPTVYHVRHYGSTVTNSEGFEVSVSQPEP